MSDLERLWDDLPVGRAPVDDILRAGRKKTRTPRHRPLRPLLTAGVLTAVGGAFIAGTVVSQPPSKSPGGAGPGDAGSDASPAAFHGELQPVASCDDLLDYYQDEALKLVGPYGWEFGYGYMFDQRGPVAASMPLSGMTRETAAEYAKAPPARSRPSAGRSSPACWSPSRRAAGPASVARRPPTPLPRRSTVSCSRWLPATTCSSTTRTRH